MSRSNRRTFLNRAGWGLAGAAAAGWTRAGRGGDANERLVVGAIGCGGQGRFLAKSFATQQNCDVAYVCDPDLRRAERAAGAVEKAGGKRPEVVQDLRAVLDDRSVDAVTVATPDHWHAPATLLACRAGKHVYVEKPCSHNIREGRLMVEAGRRHRRVIQVGTQSRSSPTVQEAMQLLNEGVIGDVLVAKAVNSQLRVSIGHHEPSSPPEHLDYDLWVGPAPWMPYQSNFVHYHWHWFYNFGTGDIGNDGVHAIDVARWGLGVTTHPSLAAGYGSTLFFDDDQQFPDTYQMTFEYPSDGAVGNKRLLVYEQRIWSPYRQDADGNSLFFYGTEGMMTVGGSAGIRVFGQRNRLVKQLPYAVEAEAHHRNFLEAIRSADRAPTADIAIGHLSSSICHLGNIAARVGRAVRFDPETEQVVGDDEAAALAGRAYREGHWAVPQSA